MEVNTERDNGTLIAKAEGRVDGSNAREFEEALDSAITQHEDGQAVIVDFEGLSYISSAGLRVILLTARTLRKSEKEFVVCSPLGTNQGGLRDQRVRQNYTGLRLPIRSTGSGRWLGDGWSGTALRKQNAIR